MKIEKINIKNFTVFKNIDVNFSDGINVMIGENGSGKTHILKLIYGMCQNSEDSRSTKIAQEYFKTNPLNLIRENNSYSKDLFKRTHSGIRFSNNNEISYGFNDDYGKGIFDKPIEVIGTSEDNIIPNIIYIPAKEMLSHSKGFLALNNKYDMPFDKTYIDIITNAELPEIKEVSSINQKILNIISKIIGGTVIYESDTFYILKENNKKVEFSLEAEGLRKFGLFYKLIRNGLIEKDSILLWDEPETNINPELIPVLVDILMMLQKEGVQIIIATHSYNLAKYFEIKRKENDDVYFHSLYKTEDGVKVQSDKYFGELENNSIIKADSKLLDEVIEESFED
ncbi:MAG: AAA family ATPase [Romboutsia sp.]|uniref:AAA family ATPase n=1 Tax=Romboutsia sp. TaxID=1965302 RepID=UPI003F3590A2